MSNFSQFFGGRYRSIRAPLIFYVDTQHPPCYDSQVINERDQMSDEYLTRCVVDPIKRTVYIYSSEGSEKEVVCDTTEEFMNVLKFVRATLGEDTLAYASPL